MEAENIFRLSVMAAAVVFFIFYRRLRKPAVNEFQKEMNDVLTKDEYKVKGQYD